MMDTQQEQESPDPRAFPFFHCSFGLEKAMGEETVLCGTDEGQGSLLGRGLSLPPSLLACGFCCV